MNTYIFDPGSWFCYGIWSQKLFSLMLVEINCVISGKSLDILNLQISITRHDLSAYNKL